MSEIEISGDAAPTFPQATTKSDGEEYVLWAYRLLLGREPESRDVIRNNPFKNNRQGLVNTVLRSEEFHTKNRGLPPLDNPYHSWDDEAIAFIHLPKTGGTTLVLCLQHITQWNVLALKRTMRYITIPRPSSPGSISFSAISIILRPALFPSGAYYVYRSFGTPCSG